MSLPHCLPGLGSYQMQKQLAQHETAVIPVGTPRKGGTRFLVLPSAHIIRRLAYFRSCATKKASSTRALGPAPSSPAADNKIRRLALARFSATPLVSKTLPMEH